MKVSQNIRQPLWKRAAQKLIPFAKPRERQWTVLYYGAGNNNLSRDLYMEMGSLRNAGSSPEIQVVAQVARADQRGKVVRGEMAPVPLKWGAVKPEFVETESFQADMGEAATLGDFLKWGMKTYPAKHYLVITAGHGNGHRGSLTDESTGSIITPREQREVFEQAPSAVDVLLKESCMGASLEEAYEMKDTVGYYLASQDVTSGSVNLNGFLDQARGMAREGELEPREVVDAMFENRASKATSFVGLDQAKLGPVAAAVSRLSDSAPPGSLREAAKDAPSVKPNIEALISDSEVQRIREEKRLQYRDALGFAQRVGEAGREVEEALREAIVHQYSSPEYSEQQGLSWNLSPDPSLTAGAAYKELAFAKDSGWTGVVP